MITGIGDEVEVTAGQFKGRKGIVDSYPERNIEGPAVRVRLSPGFSADVYIRDLRRGALTAEQRQAFADFDQCRRLTTSIPPPTESDAPLGSVISKSDIGRLVCVTMKGAYFGRSGSILKVADGHDPFVSVGMEFGDETLQFPASSLKLMSCEPGSPQDLAETRSPVAAAAERVVAAEVELKNAWLDLERSIDQEVRERSKK